MLKREPKRLIECIGKLTNFNMEKEIIEFEFEQTFEEAIEEYQNYLKSYE